MRLIPVLIAFTALLSAQSKQIHHQQGDRIYATVPLIGTGKPSDPIRPMFVPAPGSSKVLPKLAYTWLPSDDKKSAIVEFTSNDKTSLAPIRAASAAQGVKVLDPKVASKGEIESEFKRLRKDFDPSKFGRGRQ